MKRRIGRRARWLLPQAVLLPCAVVGIFLTALPQRAAAADDPREWLEKMNNALATRNYDGTFFHLSEGRVETMRIVHRVRGGRTIERLLSLDGSGREFVRNDDELTCYLPDQHTVLVEPRQDHGPFLGTLPTFGADVNEFYDIEQLSSSHVLGRPARVIAVNPKDQFRFGYRLWLDEKTAMPLKTQLCDARGQVIEQILFARLDMPETIADSELAPAVRTEGMRWVRQGATGDSPSSDLSAYRASQLPPGFRLTVSGTQTLGGATVPATHMVYSDGLATVSVFVEAPHSEAPRDTRPGADTAPTAAEPPLQGLARVGSGFAFSTVVQGHQVTAVGEVPAQTVEFIAHIGPIERRQSIDRPLRGATAPRFLVYSRAGCGLCDELLAALGALPGVSGYAVDVVDVDADAAARVRYGHKVPVLLFAGELVCHGHLDPDEVHKALAHHLRPV